MKIKQFLLIAIFILNISCEAQNIEINNSFYQSKIMAHRGFSSLAPENTISAFQKAIEIGADFIELDVRKTKDDSLVVIHDESVDRTSSNGMKGNISSLMYKDLNYINVGYSEKFGSKFYFEKIPTLYEVLKLAKGKINICIELKSKNIELNALSVIKSTNTENDVIVSSFDSETLSKIKTLNKDIKTLYLVNSTNTEFIESTKNLESFAIGIPVDYKNQTINKNYLDYSKQDSINICVYTVNDNEEILRLLKLGVYAIITDVPDKALKIRNQ